VLDLDARKQEILKAVIQAYVSEAEPVGSERVAQRLRARVSPATVRNEMAALEDLGILTHPHTSAGRITTDLGYRLYVEMLRQTPPTPQERTRLRRLLADHEERETLAGGMARALAAVTEYAALVSAPSPDRQQFKHLHLIPLGATEVMAVIVTDAGTTTGRAFDVREALEPEDLDRLSRLISQRLQGYELREITGGLLARMVDEATWQQRILEYLLQWIQACRPVGAERRVYIEGAANILKQPEFRDARAAEPVLSALEDEDVVADLLRSAPDREVWVIIGTEHRREELRGTSVVAAPYRIGDRAMGALGIVGPTRMQYGRIISLVRYLAGSVGELLSESS